jgi:hypothetical protein
MSAGQAATESHAPLNNRHSQIERKRGSNFRTVALLGRTEAARLCRSPLVVAGALMTAALIWWNSRATVPQWSVWNVQIDSIMLALAGLVLIAAQLAASRVRRDGTTQLYDALPATAALRAGGYLLGIAGPVVIGTLLMLLSSAWITLRHPVGSLSLMLLIQGVLLVALGGVIGVALGCWFPHPVAGPLAAVVIGAAEANLILPSGGPIPMPGGIGWLFPWAQPVVLRWLPEPGPAIPPSSHWLWLMALIALGVTAAVWRGMSSTRTKSMSAVLACVVCISVAISVFAGWAQLRPVPARVLDSLAYQLMNPAKFERCVVEQHVRYCAYPGFAADVARWADVVNGVLSRVPATGTSLLTVRQVADVNVFGAPFYAGSQPTAANAAVLSSLDSSFGRFVNAETSDPYLIPGSSVPPVYTDINWGNGAASGAYELSLSMQVGRWIARLPTTWQRSESYNCGANCTAVAQLTCVPVGQAREAVALWLAASATPGARDAFLSELASAPESTRVGRQWVATYTFATGHGYQAALQFTAQAAVLARAMLLAPRKRVEAALAASWPKWLAADTTDVQLAAALKLPMPPIPRATVPAFALGEPADPVCR